MPRSRKRGQRERPTQTRTATAASPTLQPGLDARPPEAAAHPREAAAHPPEAAAPERRPTNDEFLRRYQARAQERDAAARAELVPLGAGERPWPILVSVVLTALAAIFNIVAFATGTKIEGTHPDAAGIILFAVVMLACAIGMWRLWYQAVLAFMVLLAVVIVLFSLFLVEASNALGVIVPLVFVFGGGFLFWKLVRVLARLQMPTMPTRPS
jgi:hypothetical protein